jgi:hypothetical protein
MDAPHFPEMPSDDPSTTADDAASRIPRPERPTVDAPASSALGRLRAGAGAAAEQAVSAAFSSFREMPGMRVRRVRRLGSRPLPSLPERYPEAVKARPVEIGTRTIEVDDIVGTAVGGGDQRGADFLPLKAFRGQNWNARWQRLRKAQDGLVPLPTIDVVKYADRYWVVDGHNRVALALYGGQQDIDASVVELVAPGEHRTEPLGSLAAQVEATRPMRARAAAEDPTP